MRRRESVKKEERREGRERRRDDSPDPTPFLPRPLHCQPVPSQLFQSEPLTGACSQFLALPSAEHCNFRPDLSNQGSYPLEIRKFLIPLYSTCHEFSQPHFQRLSLSCASLSFNDKGGKGEIAWDRGWNSPWGVLYFTKIIFEISFVFLTLP